MWLLVLVSDVLQFASHPLQLNLTGPDVGVMSVITLRYAILHWVREKEQVKSNGVPALRMTELPKDLIPMISAV